MSDALDAMSNVLGIVVVGGVITKVADSAFGSKPAAPKPTKRSKSRKGKYASTQSYNQRMHEAVFGR